MDFPTDNKQKHAKHDEPSRQLRRRCRSTCDPGCQSPFDRPKSVAAGLAVPALDNVFPIEHAKQICGDSETSHENIQHRQSSLHKMQEVESQKPCSYDSRAP